MAKAQKEISPDHRLTVQDVRRQTLLTVESALDELHYSISDTDIKRYIASGYLQERAAIKITDAHGLLENAKSRPSVALSKKAVQKARELQKEATLCMELALRVHPSDLVEELLNPRQNSLSPQQQKAQQLGRIVAKVERTADAQEVFAAKLHEQTKGLSFTSPRRRLSAPKTA